MLRVAPPKSKVQQRLNTKMTTNLRLWLSKLLMNFHKLTIGGCPFSKEHRWRFFSTVTYCQKSEVFMIVIMIGTTFLFCDMGCPPIGRMQKITLFLPFSVTHSYNIKQAKSCTIWLHPWHAYAVRKWGGHCPIQWDEPRISFQFTNRIVGHNFLVQKNIVSSADCSRKRRYVDYPAV